MLYRSLQQVAERFPLVSTRVEVGARAWELLVVQNQDTLVDAVDELEYLPYGFLLWESAVGLARYLAEHPERVAGKRVMELGCGVGLPGLVAASLGATVAQTDHQQGVLLLAKENTARNGIDGITQFVADWTHWTCEDRYDLIMGADILYDRKVHFDLESIFFRNLAPGGRILISDPGRMQAMEFMQHLERRGWKIELTVKTVQLEEEGVENRPVEVALMSAIPGERDRK